jgi:hypothetical protein
MIILEMSSRGIRITLCLPADVNVRTKHGDVYWVVCTSMVYVYGEWHLCVPDHVCRQSGCGSHFRVFGAHVIDVLQNCSEPGFNLSCDRVGKVEHR